MNRTPTRQAHSRLRLSILSVTALGLMLTACGDREPKGQTVATVNGDPITRTELDIELAAVPAEQRAALRKKALDGLIDRKLMVQAAKEKGLNKTPDYTLQVARLTDILLAQQLMTSLMSASQTPTDLQVNSYLSDNPAIGADRRLIRLQQVAFAESDAVAFRKDIEATRTLPELIGVLKANGVEFSPNSITVDTAVAPDEVLKAIDKAEPGEPFILMGGGKAIASSVLSQELKPIDDSEKAKIARQRLQNEKTTNSFKQSLSAWRAKAKISYAKEFAKSPGSSSK